MMRCYVLLRHIGMYVEDEGANELAHWTNTQRTQQQSMSMLDTDINELMKLRVYEI